MWVWNTVAPWEGNPCLLATWHQCACQLPMWKHPSAEAPQPMIYGFSLPAGNKCVLSPLPHRLLPRSYLSVAFFSHEHFDGQLTDFRFVLSQLHIPRWQIWEKKQKQTNRRWTLFEYLKLKHNIFHLTSLLSAGGSLEISLKWRPHPDYPETRKRSSFYPPHLFWALLHGAIICSSQLSPQTGFGDKLLGQDRKYCFMRCVLATECLWPL